MNPFWQPHGRIALQGESPGKEYIRRELSSDLAAFGPGDLMRRSIATLVISLMLSMTFAGCFTDDPDDHGHGDNGNGDGGNETNNNTTTDPWGGSRVPPEPVVRIGVEADGENITGPPFLVTFNSFANVTFDASDSIVHQGDIEGVSWRVVSDSGFDERSTNLTFTADLGQMKTARFGVYEVTLRIQDSAGVLGETINRFAIDYHNVWSLPDGFIGPGTASRDDPGESQPSDLGAGIIRGTFVWEQVTLGPNAVDMNATLTFETSGSSDQMQLFLFDPSVASTGDSATAEPTAASEPADSPIQLPYSEDGAALEAGPWKLRAELDGVGIESFELEVIVTYSTVLFGTGPETEGSDDDEDDGDSE